MERHEGSQTGGENSVFAPFRPRRRKNRKRKCIRRGRRAWSGRSWGRGGRPGKKKEDNGVPGWGEAFGWQEGLVGKITGRQGGKELRGQGRKGGGKERGLRFAGGLGRGDHGARR